MRDREDAQLLLAVARRDLTALGGMADAAVFADEIFGFLAQQANLSVCVQSLAPGSK